MKIRLWIYLEGSTVRANETLSSLDKLLFVADHARNLDNVAGHVVLHDAHSLLNGDTTRQQLDQISKERNMSGFVYIRCNYNYFLPSFDNCIRIPSAASSFDDHRTLEKIQHAVNAVFFQLAGELHKIYC